MLSINNVSYFIGGRPIYENASLHIKPKDKIGLIGLNGRGKSTLLRLIEGSISIDSGSISKSKECTLGFLNQDLLSYSSQESILTVAMQAFAEAVQVQQELDKVLKKMETDYSDKLMERFTALQEDFERLDGYSLQARAEEVLEGIGFNTKDLQRPLKEFSGGWRMRVMLAKLLLEQPSLLMLDEPTNHLDLPSIEWIENYLRNYEGAVIVVSHDRQFLDNTVKKIVEVDQRILTVYEGNYTFYLEEKEMRKEIQKNAFENQQQKIRQTERFIERFRAKSTKAKQVQSRVKSLERMDKIDDVVEEAASINFRFKIKQKSGRQVVQLKDISKSYGPLDILKKSDALIERGDKIALIGANGKGKSTLLRIIAGTESHEGKREIGYNVHTGFYAQHQLEALNIENEMLEELVQAGSEKTEQELRNVLGCFLFSDEDVFKKIKVLSGGEKSRVALAKTLIDECNFLMLDEPTNHLDFISENILAQALQQYEGTFVLVSHNRHFISEVANKIWYIEDYKIKEYPGTYDEYRFWREKQLKEKAAPVATAPPPPKPVPQAEKPAENGREKALKESIKSLEETIIKLEGEKETLEQNMADIDFQRDPEEMERAGKRYKAVTGEIDAATQEWESMLEALDAGV